jgi:ATP-dependent Clp protease ATP-binding subunit ClpC
LLGLLREDQGLAARVLMKLDVKLDDVRSRVLAIVGEGEKPLRTGQIPFTPRAKKTLELGLRESQRLGHNYIGTEHLLLALALLDDGVGPQILRDLGLDGKRIRNEMMAALESGVQASRDVWPKHEDIPGSRAFARSIEMLAAGWTLFAVALGIGILIGWAIWHH